jgi:hypothetical protein
MKTLQEIESAIAQLPPEEFARLREWVLARDAEAWDAQLEKDIQAGKLDQLAEEAIRAHRAGQSSEL